MPDWVPVAIFEKGVHRMLENIDYWRKTLVWTAEFIDESTANRFRLLEFGNDDPK